MSFNKKFVCIFLIVFTLIGLSAVALQNALGSQGFPVDSNPVSTESPSNHSTEPVTVDIFNSTYQGVAYDLYVPSNYSGSLVVLAGGIMGENHFLIGWGQRLAERGYAALAFSTKPEGLDNVCQYVTDCKSNLEIMLSFVFNPSAFPITVDPEHVSLMGMSGGGASVLSIDDERVRTTIAVCPYYVNNTAVEHPEPVLIITGQNDYIAPHDSNGAIYYDGLNSDKMIVEQANTPEQDGHDIFEAGWKYTFAWLDYYVAEDPGALDILANVTADLSILESSSVFNEP